MNDLELIKGAANNNIQAFSALYDKYAPLLYTLIKKIVSDKETANKVLEDVFLIIWSKAEKFNFNSGNVYTWMATLAKNKAIDQIRRSSNKITEPYTEEYENICIIPLLSPLIESQSYENALVNAGKIENALYCLTEAQQITFYIAYYEGLTEAEIASRLNIPVQTVKMKIQTILNNLKENFFNEQ
ncbi:MAG: sigma-70 family RNA polymerase sigma factor [Bacteroidota bacterium]|nr:sigma-70 family RNA polymerase sigma factor [Bacteroidota bacterium]